MSRVSKQQPPEEQLTIPRYYLTPLLPQNPVVPNKTVMQDCNASLTLLGLSSRFSIDLPFNLKAPGAL